MSLYSLTDTVPEYYIVCLINSSFISYYVDDFVNNTQTFQINDARQIPVVVPHKEELKEYENTFCDAIKIKKEQFSNKISLETAETKLFEIQKKLDKMIMKLYENI
jgi:hypothetical protein